MRYRKEIDHGEWADVYLRFSRMGYNRYTLDLWMMGNHAVQADIQLPEGLTEYVRHLLKKPYYHPQLDELKEVASLMWEELLPQGLRRLFDGIIDMSLDDVSEEGTSELFARLLNEMLEPVKRVRFELDDPELHYLPWEYLPLTDWVVEQAVSYPARLTPPRFDIGKLPLDLPLRVLFVTANPVMSKAAIDDTEDFLRLKYSLRETAGDSVELISMTNADVDTLARVVSGKGEWFHVIHFVGHGFISPSGPLLALESQGRSQFLAPDELGAMARAGGVRLLTLETPIGTPNYQIGAFAGFAAQAEAVGLPAILFDLRPDTKQIPDIARIYASIAQGESLTRACAEARRAAPDDYPSMGLSLYAKEDVLFDVDSSLTPKGVLIESDLEYRSSSLESVRMIEGTSDQPFRFQESISKGIAEDPQSSRKQVLQQLDFVQKNISRIERMQQTYAKRSPGWLQDELDDQKALQARLSKVLEEGV